MHVIFVDERSFGISHFYGIPGGIHAVEQPVVVPRDVVTVHFRKAGRHIDAVRPGVLKYGNRALRRADERAVLRDRIILSLLVLLGERPVPDGDDLFRLEHRPRDRRIPLLHEHSRLVIHHVSKPEGAHALLLRVAVRERIRIRRIKGKAAVVESLRFRRRSVARTNRKEQHGCQKQR